MYDRAQDKRPVMVLMILLLVLCVVGDADAAPADARVVKSSTGRTAPETVVETPGRASWAMTLGVGLSAGGDLFRVRSESSIAWPTPVAGDGFTAKRFTVTLDENAALALGFARRITDRGWLNVDLSWTEMDATALANDTQFVTPVLFDTLSMTRFGVFWEQRLTDTAFVPFIVVGATYLDVSAKAEYLSQSGLAPELGVGVIYRITNNWHARAEATDMLFQFESSGIRDSGWPTGATYTELGPQHLLTLGVGLVAVF